MSNEFQREEVLWFLKKLGEASDEGAIEILTMRDLAKRFL